MQVMSRLWLSSEPEGICTFNQTNGGLVLADEMATISVTGIDQWYAFDGWYTADGILLSTDLSFQFLIGYADMALVARFHELPFTPDNPDEPNLERIPGDVNCDGQVTIADVTALVNIILGKDNASPYQYDHDAADVNGDGSITIADVTKLVNKILGKE